MTKKDIKYRQGHSKDQKRDSNKIAGYSGLGLLFLIIYLIIEANFLN